MSADSPPALFPCASLALLYSYPGGTFPVDTKLDVHPASESASYILTSCPSPSSNMSTTLGTTVNCSSDPPPPGNVTSQCVVSSSAPIIQLIPPMNYISSEYQDVDVEFFVEESKDTESESPDTNSVPDTVPETPCLTDSGYEGSLSLQCLETVLDWKGVSQSPVPAPLYLSSTLLHSPDHRGFEDYLDDIYYHRLSIEYKYQVNNCLEGQREVTPGMRGLLISWMTGIHHQLSMRQDSLFVAVNIIDRILDIMHASRDYLQLLGISALLIAAKCEEVTPPEITELLSCCMDTYSRDQVKHLERVILNAIKFDLLVPTPQFFLEYFSSCCICLFGGFQSDRLRPVRMHVVY
ncbi:cyclin-A2-like isoform X2 [Argopecten irradians]|uniref:cyclin-A2-like isoform X2 n=1 Tax=Argopecten irradians TaxID=31199 RepID=UPI003717C0CD